MSAELSHSPLRRAPCLRPRRPQTRQRLPGLLGLLLVSQLRPQDEGLLALGAGADAISQALGGRGEAGAGMGFEEGVGRLEGESEGRGVTVAGVGEALLLLVDLG